MASLLPLNTITHYVDLFAGSHRETRTTWIPWESGHQGWPRCSGAEGEPGTPGTTRWVWMTRMWQRVQSDFGLLWGSKLIHGSGEGWIQVFKFKIQCVPLATEPGISLIILRLMRILLADCWSMSQQLGALQTHTTDTFLFISHTTNVLLFKFCCNIFMLGSVVSGTSCRCLFTCGTDRLRMQRSEGVIKYIFPCPCLEV